MQSHRITSTIAMIAVSVNQIIKRILRNLTDSEKGWDMRQAKKSLVKQIFTLSISLLELFRSEVAQESNINIKYLYCSS